MRKVLLVIFVVILFSIVIAGISFAKGHGKGSGNAVSQAAHAARAEGLKGKDLAEKVHEAIENRKESKEEEVDEKKESAKEEKAKNEKGEHHKHGKGKGRHHKGPSYTPSHPLNRSP